MCRGRPGGWGRWPFLHMDARGLTTVSKRAVFGSTVFVRPERLEIQVIGRRSVPGTLKCQRNIRLHTCTGQKVHTQLPQGSI